MSCTEVDWFELEDMRHEHRLATDRDYHLQQEERMDKLPAAEEPVTVTYKLRELEAVMKSLVTKKYELERNGEKSERSLGVVLDALDTTRTAIDQTLHRRKNRDI